MVREGTFPRFKKKEEEKKEKKKKDKKKKWSSFGTNLQVTEEDRRKKVTQITHEPSLLLCLSLSFSLFLFLARSFPLSFSLSFSSFSISVPFARSRARARLSDLEFLILRKTERYPVLKGTRLTPSIQQKRERRMASTLRDKDR